MASGDVVQNHAVLNELNISAISPMILCSRFTLPPISVLPSLSVVCHVHYACPYIFHESVISIVRQFCPTAQIVVQPSAYAVRHTQPCTSIIICIGSSHEHIHRLFSSSLIISCSRVIIREMQPEYVCR